MAGPAIRAWKIAEALAVEHEVRLLSTVECTRSSDFFVTKFVTAKQFAQEMSWADIVIHQGDVTATQPSLIKSNAIKVADLYDPLHLEVIEQNRGCDLTEQTLIWSSTLGSVILQLATSDFFLCASEKQRDFWLGNLAARGRVNPILPGEEGGVDRLLAIVPFGLDPNPPQKQRKVLRGVQPGIDEGDYILLWGGGIYNWFDPLTLIRAVARVAREIPQTRLVFMGATHPNPNVPAMKMAQDARDLSAELGLTDRHVFFLEGWVPFDERGDYLLEADVAVSTHLAHLEAAYSFRTRLLDCFWAALPVIATEGDSLSTLITQEGAGCSVPAGDVDLLVAAILKYGKDLDARQRAADASGRLAARFSWSVVLEPLVRFCQDPEPAGDLEFGLTQARIRSLSRIRSISGHGIFPLGIRSKNFFGLAKRRDWAKIKERIRLHLSPRYLVISRRRRKAERGW